MGAWQQGLLGCFGNCGLCIKTFICPCIAFGKNAEALGLSCAMYACFMFIPIFNLYKKVEVRGMIRERQGIEGSCCQDLMLSVFCGGCALVQERVECVEAMGGGGGGAVGHGDGEEAMARQ